MWMVWIIIVYRNWFRWRDMSNTRHMWSLVFLSLDFDHGSKLEAYNVSWIWGWQHLSANSVLVTAAAVTRIPEASRWVNCNPHDRTERKDSKSSVEALTRLDLLSYGTEKLRAVCRTSSFQSLISFNKNIFEHVEEILSSRDSSTPIVDTWHCRMISHQQFEWPN